jgi:outer membrane protein
MKIRIRPLLLAATLLGMAMPAWAQYKVGIVNIDRIIREAPAAVAAQKKLQQEFAPRERELATLADRLKQAQDALAKEGVTMPEATRQGREREMLEMNRELQRKQQAFQEDVTQRRNEAISVLIEQANRAVRRMAQAEKFDVIFQEAVYWSPAVDMTEKVMKALVDSPAQK